MNVALCSVMFSAFNFRMRNGDIGIKKQNPNILCDGHPSVLLHSMETAVNFMRRSTGINILYVAYLKHEHCSQQYSVRHVFVSIN